MLAYRAMLSNFETEVYVLLEGEHVRGVIDITHYTQPIAPHKVATIQYLYTEPGYEQHAFKLIRKCFEFSKKHACEATYIHIQLGRFNELRWIQNHGFIHDYAILKGPFNHGQGT
jgi:hypothetical protein